MGWPWSSALVTGASSGIGESMVRQLAAQGVPTVVVARRRDRLDALAAELTGIEVLAADLADEHDRARVAERIGDGARPIDLVVNNAGFGTSGDFVDIEVSRSLGEVELNVSALVHLSHAAAAAMVARGRGWICNVSSVASFQANPRLATYAATKAFVTSFSEALHVELAPRGVHVTALCPGLTRTEFQSVSNTTGDATKFPEFAWMTADEVARTGLDDTARGRALSIPGYQYKALVAASSMTPRMVTRKVAGLLMKRA